MFGARSVLAGFTLCGLLRLSQGALAEEFVPGGWSSQVAFQSFEGPGPFGAGGTAGAGGLQLVRNSWDHSAITARPQIVNGLVPLAEVVRRQSRKRPRR